MTSMSDVLKLLCLGLTILFGIGVFLGQSIQFSGGNLNGRRSQKTIERKIYMRPFLKRVALGHLFWFMLASAWSLAW